MAKQSDVDARLADLLFNAALEHGSSVGDSHQSDSDLKDLLRIAVCHIEAAGPEALESFKAEVTKRLDYPEYEFLTT
jgi:hypothetical protein